MQKIIKITDQNELIDTKNFPYGEFSFAQFNPVQSRIFEIYNKDANFLIAANTSAGKTCVAELLLSYEVRSRGGKGLYLSPYKSLTQEKIDEWKDVNHHFGDLNISIASGDYRLTNERKRELDDANLILATTELVNSLTRNHTAEKSEFLTKVKTAVIDEVHLATELSRGDKIEVGLMKLTEINPEVRLVGLSGTMPNTVEIAEWLSCLNKKDTYVLESTYRPCPLHEHYVTYDDSPWNYDGKEMEKIVTAIHLITTHFQDKFLVIVHSKRTGDKLIKELKSLNIESEYHNADLLKDKRLKIENRFRNDPKLRVLVATSTVGTGLNLPARRVITLGVHSGLSEIPTYKIKQYVGRAGRPKYDTRGDAYILVPQKDVAHHVSRLKVIEPIKSQLIDDKGNYKVLAFHVISEIYHGAVKNKQDIFDWYDRSLAAFQNKNLKHAIVDKMISSLKATGSVKEEEDGTLQVTAVGKIASLFYFSPFDVADINRNMQKVFENKKEMDEYWVAMALANTDTNRGGIVSAAEREQIAEFSKKIPAKLQQALTNNENFSDSVKKVGYCYYSLMNGVNNPVLAGVTRGFQMDFPRLSEVMFALDGMFKWNQRDYLKKLSRRISYGVEWKLVDLCSLPGIGKVKAKRLWDSNVKTMGDVIDKPHIVKLALGCSDDKLSELTETASKHLMKDIGNI